MNTSLTPRSASAVSGLVLTLSLLTSAPAKALEVTGSFSGWWDLPAYQTQAIILNVDQNLVGAKTAAAYWPFYDLDGNAEWLYALGPVTGDTIDATLYQVTGVAFNQPFDPNLQPSNPVGTMQITFSDCNAGQVTYASSHPIVGDGNFSIKRINRQAGTVCTGTLVDDIPDNVLPEAFEMPLLPSAGYSLASGKAEFELRPNRVDFSVEIEDLPAGDYTLKVDDIERAVITTGNTPSGTQGEVEFRSPPEPGKLPLDFEPRGALIEIWDGATLAMSNVAPDSGVIPTDPGSGTPPPFGNSEIQVALQNLGTYPLGYGKAELEQEPDRVDFKVEIEDVPLGSYTLWVDGVERATLQVVNTATGPEGEVEFRYPVEPGKILLDFDPRDTLVQVREASGAIFAVNFPSSGNPGGGGDDGGDDDDNNTGGGGGDRVEIEVELNNTGVYAEASGDAEYEIRSDRVDFKVEIEDLPNGSYTLVVGGITRGTIQVSGGEGELEFRDPVEPGKLPLDFDPRGQSVQVQENGTVILSAQFPNN